MNINNWHQYIPSITHIFWVIIAIVAIVKLSKLLDFLTEALSEQLPDGTKGKGSSKRLILFLMACGFIYGWLHSIHANTHLDPYVATLIIIFELLGLTILKPDQANALLDKLKALTNFTQQPEKKQEDKQSDPAVKVTTTTEVAQTAPAT
jgi:uncharacterized membrane protein YbjE (DUF340 family)